LGWWLAEDAYSSEAVFSNGDLLDALVAICAVPSVVAR
jgi:hypothetical protein